MREFNVTGICVPHMHYMVDISEKIEKIFKLVEGTKYFTINRGRQYGKTTTIGRLRKRMPADYICASISFQDSTGKMFADEESFCQSLLSRIHRALSAEHENEAKLWLDENVTDFAKLGLLISKLCVDKKIILIIDESDKASNNNLFVEFLSMLREKYLMRNAGDDYTFHSVILAGVYDVRNLKRKMILQGNYVPTPSESVQNSPWNIAVDFDIDMSFSAPEIETMLADYETENHSGMNISEIAAEIRFYTSGYPYLVSRICQLIDTKLDKNWTIEGVKEAIKIILDENSTLFDDLFKKIEDNMDLQNLFYDLTVRQSDYLYNAHSPMIKLGLMYCFLARKNGNKIGMHNKIFEIAVTDYFISRNQTEPKFRNVKNVFKNEIITGDFFDMELCLKKFKKHYAEIYTNKDLDFLERDGKLIFLTYLKPLINGVGFYHFESETRDHGKIDLVIDFLKQQFILEMKLWYGDSKHKAAYDQLANYLKSKNVDRGYLLTFDFRKKGDSIAHETQWVNWEGKQIFDVVVRVGDEVS